MGLAGRSLTNSDMPKNTRSFDTTLNHELFRTVAPVSLAQETKKVIQTYHRGGLAPLSDPNRHEWARTAFGAALAPVAVASRVVAAWPVAFVEAVASVPAFEVVPVEIAVGAGVVAASPLACLDSSPAVASPVVAAETAPACFATAVVAAAIAECSCLVVVHIGST